MFRSSQGALEVLLKFKHIKTRKVILDQLMTKFEVIMDQFIKEIGMVEHLFLVRLIDGLFLSILNCDFSAIKGNQSCAGTTHHTAVLYSGCASSLCT